MRCVKMLKFCLNLCLDVNKAIAADIKFVSVFYALTHLAPTAAKYIHDASLVIVTD